MCPLFFMKIKATIFHAMTYEYDAKRLHHTGVLCVDNKNYILFSVRKEGERLVGDIIDYDYEAFQFLADYSNLEEGEYPRLISSYSDIDISRVDILAKQLLKEKEWIT